MRPNPRVICEPFDGMSLTEAIRLLREGMILRALDKTQNHHQNVGRMLGVHRNTVTRVMKQAGLPLSPGGGKPMNHGNAEWQALGKERRDGANY